MYDENDKNAKTGVFLKGKKGGPGRPKGSRNQLSEVFWSDLYSEWREHGADAITKMREEKPGDFVRVVASQMPKELNVTKNPYDGISDDELAQLIALGRSIVGEGVSEEVGSGTGKATKH